MEGGAVELLRGVEGQESPTFVNASSSSISTIVTGGGRVSASRGSGSSSTASTAGECMVRGVDSLLGETSGVVDCVAREVGSLSRESSVFVPSL